MTEETILELARLYRQAERRVREGQLGVDYPTERRSVNHAGGFHLTSARSVGTVANQQECAKCLVFHGLNCSRSVS